MHDRLETRLMSFNVVAAALALTLALSVGACKGDDDKRDEEGITLKDPAPAEVAKDAALGSDTGEAEPAASDAKRDVVRREAVRPKPRNMRDRDELTVKSPRKPTPAAVALKPGATPSEAKAPAAKPAKDAATPAKPAPPEPAAKPATKPAVKPAAKPDRQAPPRVAGTRPGPAAAGSGSGGDADEPASLDVERYLSLAKVREIVGERRMMPAGTLPGAAPSPTYNSAHFAPPGKNRFGAAVQVWAERSRRDVNERYRRMRRQYPNAEETRALKGTKAFYSYWGSIQTLTLMETSKRTIISVACDEQVCSQKALLELAKAATVNL